jgi:hydrogenase nickel incorporation protein HypA/HybF
MHERSLVASLLSQVSEALDENGGGLLRTVCVEIGPLAGVERVLVEEAFRELTPGTPAEGANLVVEEVPLTIQCRDCGTNGAVEHFVFRCRSCGSTRVRVTGGDEFRLMSLNVEERNAVG